jgi:hypothetical protein
MTNRRRLLACLPLALAPAASRALVPEAPTLTVTTEACVVGCGETAAHDALRDAAAPGTDEAPAPGATRILARCPVCGRGFGPLSAEPVTL